MRTDLESIDDPRDWVRRAVEEALAAWKRCGERYLARLARQALVRDAAADVVALAARRVAPLPRRILRPLPGPLPGTAGHAFLRLEPADRRALLRWGAGEEVRAAQAEHVAAALGRLTHGRMTHGRLESVRGPG